MIANTPDVAVIGAGPAGSTLAALLAMRGFEVALIDRDRFPRDKVCGEFLSYDALPILSALGLDAALAGHRVPLIDRCRIVGRRRIYEFPFAPAARGISRLLLDEVLFRRAIAAGASDWSGWTAARIEPAPDGARVELTRDDERVTSTARIVVGAWGRWGRFDSQLGRAFVSDRRHRYFGFKRHYRPTAARPANTIDLYSFDEGYLGVSPVEGGLINICGLVHADRLAGLRGGWDAFVDSIRGEAAHLDGLFAGHEPAQEQFLSSEPVIFRGRQPVVEGIFMTGDASGIIDPLAGNGMAMGMQSAVVAARSIAAVLTAPASRKGVERRYAAEHHRLFAPRIRWSRRLAGILGRPRFLESALALGRSPAIGRMLMARTRASFDEAQRLVDGLTRS
jgi:flavin-dependent dehydrogenase